MSTRLPIVFASLLTALYSSVVATHANALVFTAVGEYPHSEWMRWLGTRGTLGLAALWAVFLVWMIRSKPGGWAGVVGWGTVGLGLFTITLHAAAYSSALRS